MAARDNLNGYEFDGNCLKINFCKEPNRVDGMSMTAFSSPTMSSPMPQMFSGDDHTATSPVQESAGETTNWARVISAQPFAPRPPANNKAATGRTADAAPERQAPRGNH
jgi:hypothetical protein